MEQFCDATMVLQKMQGELRKAEVDFNIHFDTYEKQMKEYFDKNIDRKEKDISLRDEFAPI